MTDYDSGYKLLFAHPEMVWGGQSAARRIDAPTLAAVFGEQGERLEAPIEGAHALEKSPASSYKQSAVQNFL